jgi:acetyl esterase/lipase
MLIPGGGWTGVNPLGLQTEVATSVIFRQAGYETLSVDYRAGAQGIEDVDRFYRQARRRVGRKLPICALGASAGAQVALMLAVRHPDLRCVVALAGPTDLPAFARQPGGQAGLRLAVKAFGTDGLAKQSPINYVSSIKAKLLLVYAQNDPIVPVAQGQEFARKDRSAKLIVLPPGTANFVHTGTGAPVSESGVSATAKAAANQAEAAFLAASTAH